MILSFGTYGVNLSSFSSCCFSLISFSKKAFWARLDAEMERDE